MGQKLEKAAANDFFGRFREIVSDPLNLLIARHPRAGMVHEGLVTLHNGHQVPLEGPDAYYGGFSRILEINRGVHEPLEEFAFQELLTRLPPKPTMLELGSYWAHYAMWMKQARPGADVHMVEPDPANLAAGRNNFQRNGYEGTFVQAFVSRQGFQVDSWLEARELEQLDLLHCDIQGYEAEMLEGAARALTRRAIRRLFISTHSQALHRRVLADLAKADYRIEVDSDPDDHTTSYDGFIMATAPDAATLFEGPLNPLGRSEILQTDPGRLLAYLQAKLAITAR